ncbi:MAG: hypothetical protein ACOYOA_10335 [Saprospiraceae bacterium]|jgi:hypothetical protein
MKSTLTLLCCLCLFACARRAATPGILLLSRDAQGLLTLEADGEGYIKAGAEKDVKQRVLKRIIYDGIPHNEISVVRLPMIDQTKLSSKQNETLDELLNGEEIDRFFTDVRWLTNPVWVPNVKKVQRYQLTLNYDLLRRTLESKGIIRKFGI